MYPITGITGKVGGALARTLLAAGQPVRAVVRDGGKAGAWAEQGDEVALAEMEDADAHGACPNQSRPPGCGLGFDGALEK